jgi:hypothetical protein
MLNDQRVNKLETTFLHHRRLRHETTDVGVMYQPSGHGAPSQ